MSTTQIAPYAHTSRVGACAQRSAGRGDQYRQKMGLGWLAAATDVQARFRAVAAGLGFEFRRKREQRKEHQPTDNAVSAPPPIKLFVVEKGAETLSAQGRAENERIGFIKKFVKVVKVSLTHSINRFYVQGNCRRDGLG